VAVPVRLPRCTERDLAYGHFDSDEPRLCFFCNRATYRIDIDFGGAYCGLDDLAIGLDLAVVSR
jgi:hypothetical protein